MKRVLSEARRRVVPTSAEQRTKARIADEALGLVRASVRDRREVVSTELGGSYAKGTWLAGADIDVFVVFRSTIGEAHFEEAAREIGFEALADYAPYVRYASHPYVEAVMRSTRINVVPCYDVRRGAWKSAADRSRFHTAFMRRELTPDMRDDVRLLKQMLKNNLLYGAELAREGVSGYACEVLVRECGTFARAALALARARRGTIIGESLVTTKTPVSIIDPIDPQRNLSAAISEENMGRLVMLCRAFSASPSASFFFGRSRRRASASVLKSTALVQFDFTDRPQEVIWGQAKSAAAAVSDKLASAGFGVMRSGAHVAGASATLAFVLESTRIPAPYVGVGPECFDAASADAFVEKNAPRSSLIWVGGDCRLRALRKRDHTSAADFLKDLLRAGLESSGVPGGLHDDLRRGFRVRVGPRPTARSVTSTILEIASTDERTMGAGR